MRILLYLLALLSGLSAAEAARPFAAAPEANAEASERLTGAAERASIAVARKAGSQAEPLAPEKLTAPAAPILPVAATPVARHDLSLR